MTLKRILWAAVLLYSALHLGYSIVRYDVFSGASSGDFNRAYLEALEWRTSMGAGAAVWHFHPPFYYAILLGLDSLLGGRQPVTYFFYFIQFLLFPIAVACLVKAAYAGTKRPPLAAYGIAAVLALNFQPLLETLAQHKVEGIEFFLICLAILAFRRSRDLVCGGLLMGAANLKYLPALLIVHCGIKREWKILLGSLAGAAVVSGVVFAAFGPRVLSSGFLGQAAGLMLDHKHEGNTPEASVEMQTLSGTVNRWFARPAPPTPFMQYICVGSYMPVPNPKRAFRVALILKLLAVAGWVLWIRRKRSREKEPGGTLHLLEISLTLAMILVISQAARVHYSILVLPGFILVGLLLAQPQRRFGLPEKCLFGLAYALTGMLIPGGLLNHLPPHPVWGQSYSLMYLWWSLPFYGILLFALSAALCHHRIRKGASIGK